MIEPCLLKCDHTFCKTCVQKIQRSILNRHCPICRSTIDSTELLKVNFFAKNLLAQVKAQCKLCLAEGELGGLVSHSCPEEDIKGCSNEGCVLVFKRKNKDAHDRCCGFQKKKCTLGCSQEVRSANMDVHITNECSLGDVNCPLGCTALIKRYA